MAGQTEFLQAIQELERLGETNGNQLSMEEINSYFSDMKLEENSLILYVIILNPTTFILRIVCKDLRKKSGTRRFRIKKIRWMQRL